MELSSPNNQKNEQLSSHELELIRGIRTIRIPCDEDAYQKMLTNTAFCREHIDSLSTQYPELFPKNITDGYQLHGSTDISKKMNVKLKRILVLSTKQVYTIAPSYIMPYMVGFTKDVEQALFLRRFGVPFWGIAFCFGGNAMHWYRMETAFGRNSIVGTTVKKSENLPKNLSADEKHTKLKKEKVYVATTVGDQCILGASVCANADTPSLEKGYSNFQQEVKNVDPDYTPDTVNTDGWAATGLAWTNLFPLVTIIYCFLHAFIKIRDRCKHKFKESFQEACDKVWGAYRAKNKRSFCQKIRRLREWAIRKTSGILNEKLLALCGKGKDFSMAYDYENCHRTSNMVDRLMRWMDQYLFSSQYFHGTLASSEKGIRGWAILRNFQPYSYSMKSSKKEVVCAASNLNGFMYKDNWLENLIASTSMSGYRQ